ncbi:hypothetical protein C6Q14_23420 [Burkholderia ambifaria]|nr:hypothetical protein C6Q14_23420 [Burkholderia ambifaria]
MLHLSELVTVSHIGWVGPDLSLFGAELCATEWPQRFDALFDGVPEDLTSIRVQDDTYVPIR